MPNHESSRIQLSPDKNRVALKAFFTIAEKWHLDTRQELALLGFPKQSTFYNWKRGVVSSVPYDTIERISYVLGIYKALSLLYPSYEQAEEWVRKPNRAFGEQSAIQRMTAGSITDLANVRDYLDAMRGGW